MSWGFRSLQKLDERTPQGLPKERRRRQRAKETPSTLVSLEKAPLREKPRGGKGYFLAGGSEREGTCGGGNIISSSRDIQASQEHRDCF